MYGLVHEALVRVILSFEDGSKHLQQIVERAGLQDMDIINNHTNYDDETTMHVIEIACEVMGIQAEEALTLLGPAFVELAIERGYQPMLESLGNSFYEFVDNLDNLHQNLAMLYPGMKAPSFRCSERLDGTGLELYYYSTRAGLGPFVISLMIYIGDKLFETVVDMTVLERREDGARCDVFLMQLPQHKGDIGPLSSKPSVDYSLTVSALEPSIVAGLFPWHIELDEDLMVTSIGSALRRMLPPEMHIGLNFRDLGRVVRPLLSHQTFAGICEHANAAFLLEIKGTSFKTRARGGNVLSRQSVSSTGSAAAPCPFANKMFSAASMASITSLLESDDYLKLKGQMVKIRHNRVLFVCLPNVRGINEMSERGIKLADIPVFTTARDLILTADHQLATLNMAAQLQETTAFLDRALADVEVEKERVQSLLHSILPSSIAEKLANGETVEPCEYPNCAMLFSDICSFTQMSSQVTPKQVMSMLDALFRGLDDLCISHDVYKYETIGDCFVVASGVPIEDRRYASKLAAFAIDLIKHSRSILSPLDGEPISVRCGMNAGPVTTGVIGRDRPRYNIFGDTVNTASRMESNGVPNCIQVSLAMKEAIESVDKTFRFKERYGGVEAKGKGRLRSFFIVGRHGIDPSLLPPEEYLAPPVEPQPEPVPTPSPRPRRRNPLVNVGKQTIV
nr:soluble guanylate cyclase 1 [Choanoeca flexa]|eukprot:TRINITY_DN6618_c0_g1_i1.p1 TRINITY_DN6618_c0_g1~~TRINITY_DN6618_c0_g1_i1.p1  ORF type:complete len:696 (+),score=143.99 TRINITY_DN6618_c0_g1_i1:54-2090(+)